MAVVCESSSSGDGAKALFSLNQVKAKIRKLLSAKYHAQPPAPLTKHPLVAAENHAQRREAKSRRRSRHRAAPPQASSPPQAAPPVDENPPVEIVAETRPLAEERVDILVISANADMRPGNGSNGRVHAAAGQQLEKYTAEHHREPMVHGELFATPSFDIGKREGHAKGA